MHTFAESGPGVPAFLAKLWRLVDDPDTNDLISWSKDGRSFIIQNQAKFARELLPLNYKHNNMASFIRQLNMYGFHKITSIENGGLKFDKDEMEFSHPCFKKGCPYLLEHIKRKIANTRVHEEKATLKPEAVTKVLQDVRTMRSRQESLDSRFSVMKQENEALWREIASLRQKHAKQQQIVNKLIQFLITIVQPSRNLNSVKRHMQLMINDTPENAKLRKASESGSECGPVIHELEEELLDEVAKSDAEMIDPNSPYNKMGGHYHDTESPSPHQMERPQSNFSVSPQHFEYSNQSAEDLVNITTAGGKIVAMSNPSPSLGEGEAIIQSVNPDGFQVVYHVTEVPDANTEAFPAASPSSFTEENVLTTPMVRKLKEKNKQRRKSPAISESTNNKKERLEVGADVRVKTEKESGAAQYLNVFYDQEFSTQNTPVNSPNQLVVAESSPVPAASEGNQSGLFDPNNFVSNEIPQNLFEDSSSLLSGGENSNYGNGLKLNNDQDQFGRAAPVSGKFSSFISRNNGNTNNAAKNNAEASNGGASTSAAAAAASVTDSQQNFLVEQSNQPSTSQNRDAMAVAKYKTETPSSNEAPLRLSSVDEVSGHLENMQDELESLKDLLRGDNYSLDASTLLGLFNDSEILSPYNLAFSNDNVSPKGGQNAGSELMSYQPVYDFSELLDTDLETDVDKAPPTPRIPSELNTPYHA